MKTENMYTLIDKNSCDIQRNICDKSSDNAILCDDTSANNEIRDHAYLLKDIPIINENSNKLTNNINIMNGKISACILLYIRQHILNTFNIYLLDILFFYVFFIIVCIAFYKIFTK